MIILKKLLFAPFFLITFTLLILNLNSLFSSYDFIFSLSLETLISLITISALLILSGVSFALFVGLSQELMFILPVISLATIIPLFIIKPPLGIAMIIGTLIVLLVTLVAINDSLKKYLTFDPKAIFNPSVKLMAQIFLLNICFSYFLSINQIIAKDGFQIPDSLIETALQFTPGLGEDKQTSIPSLSITKEQIELLKQNPEVLKQSGLDPKILDSLDQPVNQEKNLTDELTKQLVKSQFEQMIKPYTNIIPIIVSALLFITLMSFNSLVGIFISPLLGIIFLILEKSGVIKFTTEMRPIKKLVV